MVTRREKFILEEAICFLKKAGWAVQKHLAIKGLVLDGLATRGEEHMLLEAKARADFGSVVKGMGQLLGYQLAVEDEKTALMLILPSKPSALASHVLAEYGVDVTVISSDSLDNFCENHVRRA
jgi:hypothetical protein